MLGKSNRLLVLTATLLAVLLLMINEYTTSTNSESERLPTKGPDVMRRFFADWHRPYGAVLPAERLAQAWNEVQNLPAEHPLRTATGWELVGPSGMQTPSGGLWSGRVLDIDALTGSGTMVAAASGGLWRYEALFPLPISDDITSQWLATFTVDPNDENTILVGTGELWAYGGVGLWKTTDGGVTWQQKSLVPSPTAIPRIRYGIDGQVIHAATSAGYFRSTDDGETWNLTKTGIITDLALNPAAANVLLSTIVDEGLYVTLNAGESWVPVYDPILPTSVNRGSVTICAADYEVFYVAFAEELGPNNVVLEGVYRTSNSGYTWTDVTPPNSYMGTQGWYNNVIEVSPTDPNIVLAGGVTLWRTTNGGTSWTEVIDDDLHVDYHAIQWHPDGWQVWVGHDGGWSYSNAAGASDTWISDGNYLPITQFVHVDAWGSDWENTRVGGGSQDNALAVTTDAGSSWHYRHGGDASGFLILPISSDYMYGSFGVVDAPVIWPRIYSTDAGVSWHEGSTGLDPSDTWYPAMRLDSNYRLYTNSGPHVYSSPNLNLNWVKENITPFGSEVRDVELGEGAIGGPPVIYACTVSGEFRDRVWVKENGYWGERSNGLPPDVPVRKVVPHPTDNQRIYALMSGYWNGGQKLFESTNRGLTWTNITGDLPNVPLSDLVANPYNDGRIYVGTEFGFFRTTDGGVHWQTWNHGIPKAAMVTEMKTLDLTIYGDGGYYIIGGTFGRSIWKRDIIEDSAGITDRAQPPSGLRVLTASPNPFVSSTTISFTLAETAHVEAGIFDVSGRQVRHLASSERAAGEQRVDWDGRRDDGQATPPGVYFVRIVSGGETATRRIVLTD